MITDVPLHSECALVGDLVAPARTRRFMESRLGSFERLQDVLLAASELVSNLVQHEKLPGTLAICVESTDEVVRFEVSSWPPSQFHDIGASREMPDDQSYQGRGLWIVGAVTDRLGIDSDRDNTIWFEIDR